RRAVLAALILVAMAIAGVAIARSVGSASNPAANVTAGGRSSNSVIPRGHPQAVQPTAGMSGSGQSTGVRDPGAVGDPTAHAPPLSAVKRQLAILNYCGGAPT